MVIDGAQFTEYVICCIKESNVNIFWELIMDYMKILTIFVWVFGVIATGITARRMYMCAHVGMLSSSKLENLKQKQFKAANIKNNSFLLPLVIAIICWAFIIFA